MMTATTTKAVNYTPEQTVEMVSTYVANPTQSTVETLALNMGKTVRSVIAKLSREKVYVAKVYTTKTGETVAKKDDLADKLGAIVEGTEAEIESLTKVNKTMLKKLLDAFEAYEAQKREPQIRDNY